MTAQLPKDAYAQTKATVDAYAYADSREGENKIPLDQRRCDGFMGIMDSVAPDRPSSGTGAFGASKEANAPMPPKPFLVVAHVPSRTWSMTLARRASWRPSSSTAV